MTNKFINKPSAKIYLFAALCMLVAVMIVLALLLVLISILPTEQAIIVVAGIFICSGYFPFVKYLCRLIFYMTDYDVYQVIRQRGETGKEPNSS